MGVLFKAKTVGDLTRTKGPIWWVITRNKNYSPADRKLSLQVVISLWVVGRPAEQDDPHRQTLFCPSPLHPHHRSRPTPFTVPAQLFHHMPAFPQELTGHTMENLLPQCCPTPGHSDLWASPLPCPEGRRYSDSPPTFSNEHDNYNYDQTNKGSNLHLPPPIS